MIIFKAYHIFLDILIGRCRLKFLVSFSFLFNNLLNSCNYQVIVSDINTQFIEHIIFIIKNVLENKTDHPAEHLGVTSIEPMMLAIVR